MGQKAGIGCPQTWRSSAEDRQGGWGWLAPENRGSLESEEISARGLGGIEFPGAVSRAPCPPAGPQPQIIFLLKSWLHPGIPKTALTPPPLCQPALAPSAAWQTPAFCPPTLRQSLWQKLTPRSPLLPQLGKHPPLPHLCCQPDPAPSAVGRGPQVTCLQPSTPPLTGPRQAQGTPPHTHTRCLTSAPIPGP